MHDSKKSSQSKGKADSKILQTNKPSLNQYLTFSKLNEKNDKTDDKSRNNILNMNTVKINLNKIHPQDNKFNIYMSYDLRNKRKSPAQIIDNGINIHNRTHENQSKHK